MPALARLKEEIKEKISQLQGTVEQSEAKHNNILELQNDLTKKEAEVTAL